MFYRPLDGAPPGGSDPRTSAVGPGPNSGRGDDSRRGNAFQFQPSKSKAGPPAVDPGPGLHRNLSRSGQQGSDLKARVERLVGFVRNEVLEMPLPENFSVLVQNQRDIIVPPGLVARVFNYDPQLRPATVFAALAAAKHYHERKRSGGWQTDVIAYRYMLSEELAVQLLNQFYSAEYHQEAWGGNPLNSQERKEGFKARHNLVYNTKELAESGFPGPVHYAHVQVITHVLEPHWDDDNTALELAVAAGAKRFLSSVRVTAALEQIWRGNVHHSDEGNFEDEVSFRLNLAERSVLLSGPLALRQLLKVPRFQWLMETVSHLIVVALYTYILFHRAPELDLVYLVLVYFVVGFTINEYQKLKQQFAEDRYFSNAWNLTSLCILAIFWAGFITRGLGIWVWKDRRDELRELSFQILSLNSVLVYIHVLNVFAMNKRFGLFLAAIRQMFTDAFFFIVILGAVVVGFGQGITATGMGKIAFFDVCLELFKGLFGDSDFSFTSFIHPFFGRLLLTLYLITCLVVLLNLLIALLNDSYSRANSRKEWEWRKGFATLAIGFTGIPDGELLPPPFDLIAIPFMPFINYGGESCANFAINCYLLLYCVACPFSLPVAAVYSIFDYIDHRYLKLSIGHYAMSVDRQAVDLTADQINQPLELQLAIMRKELALIRRAIVR